MDEPNANGVPNVGEILKRFRTRRGESLRAVAEGTGISPSFLSMLERGESDITIGRLAAIADHFGHDIGSLLGFTARRAQPAIIRRADRLTIDRGTGVDYQVLHVPGTELELVLVSFAPRSGFRDDLTHEGVDVAFVLEGRVTVTIAGADYTVDEGEAAVWSGAYRHRIRNDQDQPASLLDIVTERVY